MDPNLFGPPKIDPKPHQKTPNICLIKCTGMWAEQVENVFSNSLTDYIVNQSFQKSYHLNDIGSTTPSIFGAPNDFLPDLIWHTPIWYLIVILYNTICFMVPEMKTHHIIFKHDRKIRKPHWTKLNGNPDQRYNMYIVYLFFLYNVSKNNNTGKNKEVNSYMYICMNSHIIIFFFY